jgi:hypothetical protein
LEVLVYYLLLGFGFEESELFRAVIAHRETGALHMVTLWFEDPDDPWVIDPTGYATEPLRKMSELGPWIPRKLFTRTAQYTVRGPER